MPPQEAAPYPSPPGSQPQHRGTEVSPVASAARSVPPVPKNSGHLRHHRGESKLPTTASIAALVPQAPLVEPSGAASTPSLKTTLPGSSHKQTRLYRWTNNGPSARSYAHATSDPRRTAHGPPQLSPAPAASHH
jgi:hypothetical protein